MNKKITTVIILIIICASSIIVSILYLIKNDIIDINDIYTNADAKNTQVANENSISSTENSAVESKSCVLLEEGAEYDTMYDDRTSMNRLYEKFILEYYAKECPQVTATASQIQWALDDGIGTMLPVMQSDIMLTRDNEVLIIDAKYYTHTTQAQYDVHTLHSGNLYQIFTYVKNKDAEFGTKTHRVSGMLLYAATDEVIQPDNIYQMSGNKVSVKTLDLNQSFSEIAKKLNAIVAENFDCG